MATNKNKNQIELFPLGKNKDIIYKALLNSRDVCDLVLGENSKDDAFAAHYFNTLIIDTTQLETKTYITLDTIVSKAENKKIKCIDIIMDVFSSLPTLALTPAEQINFYEKGYFGNRIDVLIDAIKREISDLDIGIGNVTLKPNNPISIVQPTDKHYGKRVIYQCYDF